MSSVSGKRYLEDVLGWKGLPTTLVWPHESDEETEVTVVERLAFAVYAPSLDSENRPLLLKMMSAIGLRKFDLIETEDDFPKCFNILWFSSSEPQVNDERIKIWKFVDLNKYSSGLPAEVTQRKKEAWNLLKQFKSEVLSE